MSNKKSNFHLTDSLGRTGRYLRLSITDRCNFKCAYCHTSMQSDVSHKNVLRYEEFLRLAKIAASLGMEKIRITGGEPFARKDCTAFLSTLHKALPDIRLCVTTNGSLLEPHIKDLAKIQPGSFNISLDSFDPDTFRKITGQDQCQTVLANIDRLLCAGQRVKINAVAMRGVTDVQFDDFVHAVKSMPIDARFIEYMPMGNGTNWSPEQFLSAKELMELASRSLTLHEEPAPPAANSGPARMFSIPGARGRLGFISPLSQHFCNACNRLRITSTGRLRLCLFSDRQYRLGGLLRSQKITDATIGAVFARAMLHKPLGADLLKNKTRPAVALTNMHDIGG